MNRRNRICNGWSSAYEVGLGNSNTTGSRVGNTFGSARTLTSTGLSRRDRFDFLWSALEKMVLPFVVLRSQGIVLCVQLIWLQYVRYPGNRVE